MPRAVQRVTVVIATRNRAPQLARSLEALARQTAPAGVSVDAMVVDNGSTDATPQVISEAARTFPFPLRAVREEEAGRSRALNRALVETTGDLVFLLDDDARPFAGWLQATWEAFAQRDADVVGGRLIPPPDFRPPDWYDGRTMSGMLAILDWGDQPFELRDRFPYGANMSFRRDTALRLGGYDLRLGRTGTSLLAAEDNEFCQRVLRSGGLVLYWPASRCEHDVIMSRLTQGYMRRWKLYSGRSKYYVLSQSELPRIGRLPRTILRAFATEFFRWTAASVRLDGRRAFEHELNLRDLAGSIYESIWGYRKTARHPVLMPRAKESVSVVIPARNSAATIGPAIRSVLEGETLPDEILVIDDRSEDGTAQIAAALSPLVRVLPSHSPGACAARNAGVAAASGEWIAFLNSGERWTPGRLKSQLETIGPYPEVSLVSSKVAAWDLSGEGRALARRHPHPGTPGFHVENLLREDYVFTSTVLARRRTLLACGGFREDLDHGADFDLWSRVVTRYSTMFVDHVGALLRPRPVATGPEFDRMFIGREDVAEKRLLESTISPPRRRKVLDDLRARISYQRGSMRLRSGDGDGARADALRYLRLRPLDPRGLGLLISSAFASRPTSPDRV